MKKEHTYREIHPIKKLENLVHSFWMHHNKSDEPEQKTIVPDSYLKLIFVLRDDKIVKYFMTGLWTQEKTVVSPPNSITYGCRLKILAPEFLLQHEMASLIESFKQLDLSYLNIKYFDLSTFEKIVHQWQVELLKIKSPKEIPANKLRLSLLMDQMKGDITAKHVSDQIFWTNRQINRYLNKNLGVSLKKYLNIQKVYQSYIQIREGKFAPSNIYFDQAHFIREVKKHTGETPKKLFEEQNDRFIQLKNIKPK